MINILCNHCGKIVSKLNAIEVRLTTRHFINENNWSMPLGVSKEHGEIHLCPKCKEKLGEWLAKAVPCEFDWNERS